MAEIVFDLFVVIYLEVNGEFSGQVTLRVYTYGNFGRTKASKVIELFPPQKL